MVQYKIGMVVRSIAGHDKDCLFVILDVKNEYVYVVDGKRRTMQKPKKKKVKHIQIVNDVNSEFEVRLQENTLLDAHIRKIIKQVSKESVDV